MGDFISREAVLVLVEPDARPFLAERIRALPAADVRPVVKARWINIWSESDPNTSLSAKCSNCYMTSERPVGNFCKWCGADMKEES